MSYLQNLRKSVLLLANIRKDMRSGLCSFVSNKRNTMHSFFINQLVEFLFLHLLAITEGWLVLSLGMKVNYTRKINHFFVFFSPFLLKTIIPYESTLATTLLLPVVSLLSLCIYIKPIRERIKLGEL